MNPANPTNEQPNGVQSNPLGDPGAFRGRSTNLRKLAQSEKKSDFLPSFSRGFGGFVIEVAKIIIIALAVIIPIRAFLFQTFYVKGASMEPTFLNRDYLIVDQLSYRLHQPQRGDVVVVRNPFQPSEFFIKRLIGLPGERLTINENEITIYVADQVEGQVLNESNYLQPSIMTAGNVDVTLGADDYYVLGDNRGASLDSRSFGPITREAIIGRTAVRAWPVHRARTFSTPMYTPDEM